MGDNQERPSLRYQSKLKPKVNFFTFEAWVWSLSLKPKLHQQKCNKAEPSFIICFWSLNKKVKLRPESKSSIKTEPKPFFNLLFKQSDLYRYNISIPTNHILKIGLNCKIYTVLSRVQITSLLPGAIKTIFYLLWKFWVTRCLTKQCWVSWSAPGKKWEALNSYCGGGPRPMYCVSVLGFCAGVPGYHAGTPANHTN